MAPDLERSCFEMCILLVCVICPGCLSRHGFSQRRLSMLGSDGRRYFFLVQVRIRPDLALRAVYGVLEDQTNKQSNATIFILFFVYFVSTWDAACPTFAWSSPKNAFFSRFLRRYLVWYVGIVTGVGFCCCLFFVQLEQPMFVSIMSSSTWISTDLPTAWRTHAFWIQESQALCGARLRASCTQTHTYEEATSMPMLLLSLLFPDELMAMLQSS